jgi:aminopeptidase
MPMFTEKQLEKYAEVLFWGLQKARTGRYLKNDLIMIRYDIAGRRLAEILQAVLMERRMHVIMRALSSPAMERTFFEKANRPQLEFQPPGERQLMGSLNGNILISAPESLTHLQGVDSAKIARAAIARKPLRDIIFKREDRGLFGWTLCSFTTEALAKHAGLTPKQYSTQIIKACYLNRPDPVSVWEDIYKQAQEIKQWLTDMDAHTYHVESENVDLKISRGDRRRWIGISGHNIPSFELFLSPDWRDTEGVFYADFPSYRNGNYIKGIRLEFKRGRVKKIDAEKGREFVKKQLAMDDGAGKLGEFSLTDTRFSKINRFMADVLFDENFGGRYGNTHVACGASYADTYDGDPSRLTKKRKEALGFNDSALHWDMVNTENKIVTAHLRDGKKTVIYEKGRFKI